MKVALTGATGFIGSFIARELCRQGRSIKILTIPNDTFKNLDGLAYETFAGNLLDRASMEQFLDDCDVLYHCAGYYKLWAKDPKIFYDINVDGTKNIMLAARQKGLARIVYTSTIAAVAAATAWGPGVNEASPFNLWETGNHYVRSKYLGEQEVLKLAAEGLPVVIVNPTGPFGPQDINPTPTGKILLDIVNGEMPVYIENAFNVVHVRDVAIGHVLAEQKGQIGQRYLLGNENIRIEDFFRLIEAVTGIQQKHLKIPHRLALSGIYGLEKICQLLRIPPRFTSADVRMMAFFLLADCRKAKEELGLPTTPIQEAIRDAIVWFAQHGYIKPQRLAKMKPELAELAAKH